MKKRKVAIYEGHLLATLKHLRMLLCLSLQRLWFYKFLYQNLLAIISMIFVKQAAHSLFSL